MRANRLFYLFFCTTRWHCYFTSHFNEELNHLNVVEQAIKDGRGVLYSLSPSLEIVLCVLFSLVDGIDPCALDGGFGSSLELVRGNLLGLQLQSPIAFLEFAE